jgi:hypothetical protein
MKRHPFPILVRLALVLSSLFLLAPAPLPPVLTQTQGAATARLTGNRLGKEGLEVRLADEPHLVLEIKARPPLEVELPDKLTRSDAWRVHPTGPAVTSSSAGRSLWRQEFDLEPLQKGKHDISLEPLRFREAGGTWQTVTWKPLPVVVTTQISRADVGEAKDITPIEELPPESSWPLWLLAVLPALFLVAGALVLLVMRRRRLLQAVPLSPEQAALRELERADNLPLATARDVERYHTQLSDVVRRYLERRFQLPASRQTTAEFLSGMGRSLQLTAEQQALLRDFLSRCDLGKFAPVPPGPEECRATAVLASRLIA